jgi:hypothetical protein
MVKFGLANLNWQYNSEMLPFTSGVPVTAHRLHARKPVQALKRCVVGLLATCDSSNTTLCQRIS